MLLKQIIIVICSLIFGYLCGSISTGTILSKKIYGKDIRDLGSKNSGATNMGRIFGLKIGLVVIILDMLKTIIPIWVTYFILKLLPNYYVSLFAPYISGLGVIIGHCYPLFFKFKGGKAVASFAGLIAATSWLLLIIGLVLYLLILKIQKKVSLTSIIVSLSLSLMSIALIFIPLPLNFFMNFKLNCGIIYSSILLISSLILIIRHKDNIKRIISGQESKIKWMK